MSTTTAAGELLPGAYAPPVSRTRVDAVDMLRGIVMVIMLLDHTRDFVHSGYQFDPTNLARTNPALFFTRWITHFCAPVFVFLAGTGAYFQRMRGKPVRELSRFLLTRGLWLVVLEFTVVRFGMEFNLDYREAGAMQVIWAIGVSMIVLAGLVHLPVKVVAAIGIAIVLFSNTLDGIRVDGWRGPGSPLPSVGEAIWMILRQPGPLPIFGFPGPVVFVLYPLIPWIGVMAAGYAFGGIYTWSAERRARFLVRLGLAMIAAFVILRAINVYGDPSHWSVQRDAMFTALSFLNTSKYPPSLLFLLMTLGPALLSLVWLERANFGRFGRVMVTYGRVPLFFYILQWYAAHGLAVLLGLVVGYDVSWQFIPLFQRYGPTAQGWTGFNLAVVYAMWLLGLTLLYPLCRWFAGVKQRRRDWWLSYL